jgi:hypothetical protein
MVFLIIQALGIFLPVVVANIGVMFLLGIHYFTNCCYGAVSGYFEFI